MQQEIGIYRLQQLESRVLVFVDQTLIVTDRHYALRDTLKTLAPSPDIAFYRPQQIPNNPHVVDSLQPRIVLQGQDRQRQSQ
jgi:hypothetical protein